MRDCSNLVDQCEDCRLAGCDLGDVGPLHGAATGSGAENHSYERHFR